MLAKSLHKASGSPELNCQSKGKQAGFSAFLQILQRQHPTVQEADLLKSLCAGAGYKRAVLSAEHACPEHSG